jgi:hypothetical protein
MILVDAHVHIYDCFNLERFLDAAYSNFRSEADRSGLGDKFTPILLLTETSKDFWFNRLREYADGRKKHNDRLTQKWDFHQKSESVSIFASSGNCKELIIIAGRQIETAEGLEVLALSTLRRFNSGIPIIDLIREVKKCDAIPVIPWGFGKWLGRRGKILDNLIETCKDLKIFLGDNGGRPPVLPIPRHFDIARRYGIRILPGSDPLQFRTEYNRAGSFGFLLEDNVSATKPAESLNQILMTPGKKLQAYGSLENPFRFFRNQLKMQIKKRFSKLN